MIERLISNGVSVNYRTSLLRGDTALTAAVRQRSVEVVDLLLKAGADPNVRDAQGFSPLYLALASPSDAGPIIKNLIRAGADVESVSKMAHELAKNDPNRAAFEEAVSERTGK